MKRTAAALLLIVAASCRRAEEKRPVQLVTTPAVLASGLLQHVTGVFTRQSHVPVNIRAAARLVPPPADADVVVSGDATTAQALLLSGQARLHNRFAFQDVGGGGGSRAPLTVFLLRRPKPNKDAEWLVEWMMSFRGREAVQSFAAPDGGASTSPSADRRGSSPRWRR